ncbi:MAG: TraR/DksA C4-type zinc finger protein [Myxococcales bacterium]|nr:TraR/DksA C4-type zinc finger protein [Myxococcales bacterium]
MAPDDEAEDSRWRRIKAVFVDMVGELSKSGPPTQGPLERVLERLLIEACAKEQTTVDEFVAALESDEPLRDELQAEVSRLLSDPALSAARKESQRRELERHLMLLRFLLGGAEPPEWVWEPIDEEERTKIRNARQTSPEDPSVLTRIENALKKAAERPEAFGSCEACKEPIAPARLELIPFAERCAKCQKAAETKPEERPTVPVRRF